MVTFRELKSLNAEQSRQIKLLAGLAHKLMGIVNMKANKDTEDTPSHGAQGQQPSKPYKPSKKVRDEDLPSDEEMNQQLRRSGTEVGDQVTVRAPEGGTNLYHGERITPQTVRVTARSEYDGAPEVGDHVVLMHTGPIVPKGK